MAAMLPLLLGGGAAAGTTAAAVSLTQLATIMSVASAGLGIVSTVSQSNYNAKVAAQNAEIAAENAERAIQTSQVRAQESDVRARGELGAFLADAGASGFAIGSPSITGERRSHEELAAKDRGYIRHEGDVQARDFLVQAQDFEAEAKMRKREGLFGAIGGAFDMGTSLISGASSVNRIRRVSLIGD